MIKKRLLSLFIACLMLLPFASAFADGDSSGSSRTGDAVTWTAGSGGGIAGYSDTTTIDDVDGDSLGINSTLNAAYKSKDHIEDQIGDWLGSHGDLQLSHVFWDGVHGQYINIEQYGFTLEQLLLLAHIAAEYEAYTGDVQETLHLTDDVIEEAEQQQSDFQSALEGFNISMFDTASYNPGGGINLDIGNPDIDAIKDKLKETLGKKITEAINEFFAGIPTLKPAKKELQIVLYEDYMKAEFGKDIFEKYPALKLEGVRIADFDSIGGDKFTLYPCVLQSSDAWDIMKKAFVHPQQTLNESTHTTVFWHNSFGDPYPDQLGEEPVKEYVFGRRWSTYGWECYAQTNYHLLKDPKKLYDASNTIVMFKHASDFEVGKDYPGFQEMYVFQGHSFDYLYPTIRGYQVARFHESIEGVKKWFSDLGIARWIKGQIGGLKLKEGGLPEGTVQRRLYVGTSDSALIAEMEEQGYYYAGFTYNVRATGATSGGSSISLDGSKTYYFVPKDTPGDSTLALEQAIQDYNEEHLANLENYVTDENNKNQTLLNEFADNMSEIPSGAVDSITGSGYSLGDFENILPMVSEAAKLALQAVAAGFAYPEGLEGDTPQDILDAMVGDQLADAEASAGAHQAALDAAQGEAIAEMTEGISESTDFLTDGSWPGVSGVPSDYDYEHAYGILQATFGLSDDQVKDFAQGLIDTIEACYTESIGIDGVGPTGQIVDFETKEARYLALQAYLLMMCARDTINVQHIVVAKGNSYINNCIMSQSPIQFPVQMIGGVANYCWAIECIDSPYKEDIGNFTTMATYGNQLQYRFTSPGTYRIVATQNMLNNIESVVAMDFHEYWIIEETGQVIYSRIVKGHVNTVGGAQYSPAGRQGDDVCLYFNRRNEQTCYMDCDESTGIPGTVVYEIIWVVTGDVVGIPPAGAFGTDSTTRQTG